MGALLDLKRQGKIRAIGISNATPETLAEYLEQGPVDAIQERYSLIDRDIESTLLPPCRDHGVASLGYSAPATRAFPPPTASGSKPSSRHWRPCSNAWIARTHS
ncbi:hypothetical protein G6F22_019776 [Rhizopus arrhizus]|nr:hypothetical protein G6F22_019776 [Rhizopus arrhizus]